MLKIEKAMIDRLDFDFEAALKKFAEQKDIHRFTIDLPAPSAHPLVEEAHRQGGFEVIEPVPEPEPVEKPEQSPIEPDPQMVDARARLTKLPGKTVGVQLDELRALLGLLLDRFFPS